MARKKDSYPSKTTLNLFYKEDRTTRPATISLYVLFVLTLLLGAAKIGIYDPLMELYDKQEILAQKERRLETQMEYLKNYDTVSSQYARYSYSYLTAAEMLCDRMDVLDMLEATVFQQSTLESMTVAGNVLSLRFYGPDLQAAAALARAIEEYEFVEYVTVNTATLNVENYRGGEVLATTMIIDLIPEITTEEGQTL